MKRNAMRIVGLNYPNQIYIQRQVNGEWIQSILSLDEFLHLMQSEFEDYLKEYLLEYGGEFGYEMARFFYEYGEGDNENSETFVFE